MFGVPKQNESTPVPWSDTMLLSSHVVWFTAQSRSEDDPTRATAPESRASLAAVAEAAGSVLSS